MTRLLRKAHSVEIAPAVMLVEKLLEKTWPKKILASRDKLRKEQVERREKKLAAQKRGTAVLCPRKNSQRGGRGVFTLPERKLPTRHCAHREDQEKKKKRAPGTGEKGFEEANLEKTGNTSMGRSHSEEWREYRGQCLIGIRGKKLARGKKGRDNEQQLRREKIE